MIVYENKSLQFDKAKLSVVMSTNDSGFDIKFSRQGFTEDECERKRQRARMKRQRSSEEYCKNTGRGLERGYKTEQNNAVKQSERRREIRSWSGR